MGGDPINPSSLILGGLNPEPPVLMLNPPRNASFGIIKYFAPILPPTELRLEKLVLPVRYRLNLLFVVFSGVGD